MKPSNRIVRGRVAGPLFALLAAAALPSYANLLVATPSPVALTCSTSTGPGASANVVVKPSPVLTGSATLAVTFGSVGAGLVVTAPATTTLSTTNQSAGITYSVRIGAGCAGASTGSTTFRFSAAGTPDATVTVTVTVTTGTTSPLVTAPSAISLTCTRTPPVSSGSATYTPGPPVVVGVTSATTGGTPFTVNSTNFAPPAWLTVTPLAGGTATATAVNLSFAVVAGCGSFAAGSATTASVHLVSAPAPDKFVQVTLHVVPPSTLVATPSSAQVSYVKGSGQPGRVDVNITSATSPPPFFTVDTTSLPIWLNVDSTSGSAPKSLRFSTTTAADSMAPGTYSGTVRLQVSNYANLSLPVTLQLNNPAPKLTVAEGLTRNISWTTGSPLPTPFVTAVSSDSPIPYSVATGGALNPIVAAANMKDLAYSYGTPIPISFDPNIFAAAAPGSVMTGTVSLTWGSQSTTTIVTLSVTVAAPGAAITSITPASLPTAPAGQSFTLVLSGSNFVQDPDPTIRTKVGIVTQSGLVVDPSISINVVNASNITLTIMIPSPASPNLPFAPSGPGGTVVLGVCNPSGAPCSTPTSTVSFSIGGSPIIQAVTSSSSFLQVTAPTVQTVSPFDLISVFGANFCSSAGTGCASSDILRTVPDPVTLAYPSSLSPDAAGATQRNLTAVFQTHATPPVVIATAPLLFATNSQINLAVPSALSASSGSAVDLVVSFGYGTGATMLSSAPFPLNIADTDPGVFTVTGDGQGDGAVLSAALTPVGAAAPAGLRSTATDSDTVQIFMTGLGIPNSTGDNSVAGGSAAYSADCISIQTYLDSLNQSAGTALTAMDGLVVSSALLNVNRLVPCFLTATGAKPTVTIGGVAAVVTYAGWVPDSIAGQYQVSVRLPGSAAGPFTTAAGTQISAITTPVQLPVVVTTAGSHNSQAGVDMWATRKLKVTAPSGAGLTGPVGVAWSSSSNAVVATEGTSPYRFAVTSGLLPAGLSLNAATGALSGTPAANTAGSYLVTVTATDSANFPVSDKVSFTLTVTGGLVLTNTGTAPFSEVYSVADAAMTTITATGGIYPYFYSLTGPTPVPAGSTIDPSTGIVGVGATVPAGTYHVAVTALDSTGGTPLAGVINFDLNVALKLTDTTPANGANGTASTITTVTATGGTGAITYTLDSASAALSWLSIDAGLGIVTITNAAPASTSRPVTVTATGGSPASGAASAGVGTLTFTLIIN